MTSTIMNSSGDVLVCQTHQELLEIQHNLQQKPYDESLLVGIEDYIRRFEVAKRLRNEYPIKNSLDLAPIHTHVLFYNILINAYEQFQDVRYLNVMLKVGDTLISALELLELHCDIEQLPILIKKEMQIVDTLIDKLDVHK